MDLPTLWALELSPSARSLLHQLQQQVLTPESLPRTGHASATLRDALIRGLNELAVRAGLDPLDAAAEREPEGTQISPVLINRRSDPPPRSV